MYLVVLFQDYECWVRQKFSAHTILLFPRLGPTAFSISKALWMVIVAGS